MARFIPDQSQVKEYYSQLSLQLNNGNFIGFYEREFMNQRQF